MILYIYIYIRVIQWIRGIFGKGKMNFVLQNFSMNVNSKKDEICLIILWNLIARVRVLSTSIGHGQGCEYDLTLDCFMWFMNILNESVYPVQLMSYLNTQSVATDVNM